MILSKDEKYKRVLAFGDIHGCAQQLHGLLMAVQPTKDDLIVTLGDYIDRGPDSRAVIDTLITLHQNFDTVSLRGNHDSMLLMCLNGTTTKEYYPVTPECDEEAREMWEIVTRQRPALLWHGNQGMATLRSYCQPYSDQEIRLGDIDVNIRHASPLIYQKLLRNLMTEIIPQEHIDFLLNTCIDACETNDFIFVHGGLCSDLPLAEQSLFSLHWLRFEKSWKPYISGKKVICGHTPQRDLLVHDLDHAACLDTGVYMAKGFLSCMDVMSGQCWQIDDDLQLVRQPVVHYGDDGKIPFIRISELPDGDRQAFGRWLIGHGAPLLEGEKKDNCAWPNDYRHWWWQR